MNVIQNLEELDRNLMYWVLSRIQYTNNNEQMQFEPGLTDKEK